MSDGPPPRVVFDCNIYVQALMSPAGPSGQCLTSALRGDVVLFISDAVIEEVRDVVSWPHLASRFNITPESLALLLEVIEPRTLLRDLRP